MTRHPSHKSGSDGIRASLKAVHKSAEGSSANPHATAQTQMTPNNYERKAKSVKSVTFARLDMLNDAVFEGEVDTEGKPVGKGKLTLKNGDFYEGEFVDGCFEGSGVLNKTSEGAVYRGQFKNNMRHGEGVQTWKDGRKYEGGFCEDKRDGYGTRT